MSQHFLTFCQCYSLEICSSVRRLTTQLFCRWCQSVLFTSFGGSQSYFFDVDRASFWPLNCLIFYSGRIHISVTEQFICICHQLLQITFVHVWFGGLARWIGLCVFSRPGPFPFATPVLRHFGLTCLPGWLRFAQYHIHVVPLC